MKKLKMFTIGAGLTLVTAGVFAEKSRFSGTIYAYNFTAKKAGPILGTVPGDITGLHSGSNCPIGASDMAGDVYVFAYYDRATGVYSPYYWNF